MASLPDVSPLEAARRRRTERASGKAVEIEWFIDEVSQRVNLAMSQRIRMATELVKNRVIVNISRPVTKTITSRGVRVSDRSRPGEFPKADTTMLMKTIFSGMKDGLTGFVGTPLDYGLELELKMNRSFLVRTLYEESDKVRRLLTGPLEGGGGADESSFTID